MQRKVFRVEQMLTARAHGATDARDVTDALKARGERRDGADDIQRELATVQQIIARNREDWNRSSAKTRPAGWCAPPASAAPR